MDNNNLQFDIVLKPNIKLSQKAVSLLNNSKQHKEAGLIEAGQRLELEAAFEICNPLNIPIFYYGGGWSTQEHTFNGTELKKQGYSKKLKDDIIYDCYHKYIFSMEIYPIKEYPKPVPQNILNKLVKINEDYYPSLYIVDLTDRTPGCGSRALARMRSFCNGTGSYLLDIGQPSTRSRLDPILLYKFDYGDYYMELARWD